MRRGSIGAKSQNEDGAAVLSPLPPFEPLGVLFGDMRRMWGARITLGFTAANRAAIVGASDPTDVDGDAGTGGPVDEANGAALSAAGQQEVPRADADLLDGGFDDLLNHATVVRVLLQSLDKFFN